MGSLTGDAVAAANASAAIYAAAIAAQSGSAQGSDTIASRSTFTATASTVIWAANPLALRRQIVNTSDQDLYLRYGAAVSTTDWDDKVPAGGTKWSDEGPGMWLGEVRGILSGAIGSGAVRPMELTQ